MNINPGDFIDDCPMTDPNVEKYEISDNMQKAFCGLGCSIECGELLIARLNHMKRGGK